MAKKQSNISENSAAEQGAKPGMFIPIPTAEITNAAETARLRAEREAKEKADMKAADAVVALIRAIGVVEYTDACLKKINAAKQAYVQLTPDQKLLVENADVITTSEKEYDKLKIAAEREAKEKAAKEAKEKADKKAADAVVVLISAIGVVEYTDACLEKINAAKQAYTKLTADQKKLVENADVITTSEKEYDKLKIAAEKEAKEKADKKAADAVVVLISAIGTVEYTDVCLKKINTAKQAYAKLSADQKKLVENADVISASEKDYNELKSAIDKQAADEVITMIKNIGVIECTSDCVAKINVAKLAYDKLSPDQEGLVDMQVGDILLRMADVAKRYAAVIAEKRANERTEKEAKEKAEKKAAADVTTMISAIGTVKYTAACLKKIEAAKQAYTKLTADQKKLVENADVILASRKEYERLKIAAEEKEARKKEAEELSKKRKKHIVTIVWVICCIIGFCILVKMCSSYSLSEDETEYIIEADDLQEDIIDLQLDDSKDLPASNTSSPESEKNDWKSKYDYVYPLSDGVYKVEKRNKKGFCDKNGKVLLPCEYDYIYNKDDGLYKVEKGSKKGFVDAKTYKVLLPCEFDYIYSKADGVYKVEKGDKKGFVDAKTYKVLAPCEYDYIYSASNGLIKVEKGDKKGFLNAQTYKLVTPCIYDYIYSPSGGLIKVEIGSKTGYLNMDGSVAKQPV